MNLPRDQSEPATSERLQRTRRRWPWIVSGIAAALVVAWFVWDAIERRKLDEARAAFAKHGLPTKLEDITPPAVPDEENAAPLIAEIGSLLESHDGKAAVSKIEALLGSRAKGSDGRLRFLPAQCDELRASLEIPQIIHALELAADASARPVFDSHLEYAAGPGLLLPNLGSVRNVSRLAGARAQLRWTADHDPSTGWADVDTVRKLAVKVEREPTLIEMLTGVAVLVIVEQVELVGISDAGPPRDLDHALSERIDAVTQHDQALQRAMGGERIVMMTWLERKFLPEHPDWIGGLESLSDSSGGSGGIGYVRRGLSPFMSVAAHPLLSVNLRKTYDSFLEGELALRAPPGTSAAALASWESRSRSTHLAVMEFMIPSLAGIARTHVVSRTRERLGIILFASLKFHRELHTWPATISNLALPESFTTDQCSGKPIVFRENDGELLIYAFGPDGEDDGGVEPSDPRKLNDDGDIVIRVRPKLPADW